MTVHVILLCGVFLLHLFSYFYIITVMHKLIKICYYYGWFLIVVVRLVKL